MSRIPGSQFRCAGMEISYLGNPKCLCPADRTYGSWSEGRGTLRELIMNVVVLIAIDAFEIGEGLRVRGGVGLGRFAASEVGKGEADVEESSDAA